MIATIKNSRRMEIRSELDRRQTPATRKIPQISSIHGMISANRLIIGYGTSPYAYTLSANASGATILSIAAKTKTKPRIHRETSTRYGLARKECFIAGLRQSSYRPAYRL